MNSVLLLLEPAEFPAEAIIRSRYWLSLLGPSKLEMGCEPVKYDRRFSLLIARAGCIW